MKESITIKGEERKLRLWKLVTGYWNQADELHESHKRGRNWVATVVCDKGQPGGLRRTFWANGTGSYVAPSCEPGDYVEVAADYFSSGGSRSRRRKFFRVLAVDVEQIIVRESGTPGVKPPAIEDEIREAEIEGGQTKPQNPLADFSDEQIAAEYERRFVEQQEATR